MKIGVISDTHNKVDMTREVIEVLKSKDIEFLLHAGDIGKDVAKYLLSIQIPFIAVYGNNDREFLEGPIYKEPHYFTLDNKRFKLMHHPYFLTPDSDIIIYGHLHRFECEKKKALYLNPGEVCAREKPLIEAAILDSSTLEVDYLFKDKEWNIKRVCK